MKLSNKKLASLSFAVVLILSSCGKSNNSGAPAPKREIVQENQTLNNGTENTQLKTLQLGKIQISNAREFSERPGVTSIRGFISANFDAVMPCTLKNAIDLKKPLNGIIPLFSLTGVHVNNRNISNGTLETFEITRNGKPQVVIGMSLRGNDGVPLVGHQNDYSDVSSDSSKCTQLMTETYQFLNSNGSLRKSFLHINTVLKGDEVVKSTILIHENKIFGIQVEKKNGKDTLDQFCVSSATLNGLVR